MHHSIFGIIANTVPHIIFMDWIRDAFINIMKHATIRVDYDEDSSSIIVHELALTFYNTRHLQAFKIGDNFVKYLHAVT